MKERIVFLKFEGHVKVMLPDYMPDLDADLLAEKLATARILAARILATLDNPDGPEDAACEEYLHEGSVHASEADWDESRAEIVSGQWTSCGVVSKEIQQEGWHEDFGDEPSVEERWQQIREWQEWQQIREMIGNDDDSNH
jgi:hypothetical protein